MHTKRKRQVELTNITADGAILDRTSTRSRLKVSLKGVIELTKRELEKIRNLNGVIKIYQKELDLLRCRSLVKGQTITDMPFGSGTSDKTADIAVEIAEYSAMIDGTLAEMQNNRRKIMAYIDSVDDNILKQIYYYWCICVMSWNEVANSIGGRNTEDSIKKIYYRSFEKEKSS